MPEKKDGEREAKAKAVGAGCGTNVALANRAGHATIFLAKRQRQRNIAAGTRRKKSKIVRPQCLNGVATINKAKWQLQTTLWPDNMVTLSRAQLC